jgi:glycosyltransferase involved in cell wall biosynthesis
MLARAPKKGLRILHCLRAPVGGLFRHVRDLAAEQNALGHAVGVICDGSVSDGLTTRRLDALSRHAALGVQRVTMSREIGFRDVAAYRQIHDFARTHQIDVVHGHGAKGGAYARLTANALKRAGHRVIAVYTPHGGSLHYGPESLKGRVYMALERRLASMTDAAIFECAFAQRMFEARIGAGLVPGRVVHNGLAPADFMPHLPAAAAADVLFVGELRMLKGVDVLLRALAEIKAQRAVSATIVGDGPDAATFRELAGALGLADDVTFTGALPLAEALPLGRVMVIPSRAESFPYIVLEAAAAGIPLVATDVGGIGEIVSGSDTRLVHPGEVSPLAEAIAAALSDPVAAEARAGRLRALVAERFTIRTMTEGVLSVYAEASALTVC